MLKSKYSQLKNENDFFSIYSILKSSISHNKYFSFDLEEPKNPDLINGGRPVSGISLIINSAFGYKWLKSLPRHQLQILRKKFEELINKEQIIRDKQICENNLRNENNNRINNKELKTIAANTYNIINNNTNNINNNSNNNDNNNKVTSDATLTILTTNNSLSHKNNQTTNINENNENNNNNTETNTNSDDHKVNFKSTYGTESYRSHYSESVRNVLAQVE
jgi:hypothetical protein